MRVIGSVPVRSCNRAWCERTGFEKPWICLQLRSGDKSDQARRMRRRWTRLGRSPRFCTHCCSLWLVRFGHLLLLLALSTGQLRVSFAIDRNSHCLHVLRPMISTSCGFSSRAWFALLCRCGGQSTQALSRHLRSLDAQTLQTSLQHG